MDSSSTINHPDSSQEPSSSSAASPSLFDTWLDKAETDNDAACQFLVGHSLYCGTNGAPCQDFGQGIAWIVRAARNGNVDAQYDLGECYYYGWAGGGGDEEDDNNRISLDGAQAVYWYQRAANQGHVPSMMGLAQCYHHGAAPNMAPDLQQALLWYQRAAAAAQRDLTNNNNNAMEEEQEEWQDIYDTARRQIANIQQLQQQAALPLERNELAAANAQDLTDG